MGQRRPWSLYSAYRASKARVESAGANAWTCGSFTADGWVVLNDRELIHRIFPQDVAAYQCATRHTNALARKLERADDEDG